MRLKKTIFPLLLGGILLSVLSCAKEDEFELPTLVLSETSVALDRGAGERNISVNTIKNIGPLPRHRKATG